MTINFAAVAWLFCASHKVDFELDPEWGVGSGAGGGEKSQTGFGANKFSTRRRATTHTPVYARLLVAASNEMLRVE